MIHYELRLIQIHEQLYSAIKQKQSDEINFYKEENNRLEKQVRAAIRHHCLTNMHMLRIGGFDSSGSGPTHGCHGEPRRETGQR